MRGCRSAAGPRLADVVGRAEPQDSWADWLAARMVATGFASNSDLARATGVPDSVISRWRTSGTTPSIAQLRRLCPALQVSLLELLVAAGHVTADEAGVTAFTQPVRVARTTLDAIRSDPALDGDLRRLLELQYDAMIALAKARDAAPRNGAAGNLAAPSR